MRGKISLISKIRSPTESVFWGVIIYEASLLLVETILCIFVVSVFSILEKRYCPHPLSGVCMVWRYYGLEGWLILLVYGSIDSLWPNDLNQERIFFGTDPGPCGKVLKSKFLCISHINWIFTGGHHTSHIFSPNLLDSSYLLVENTLKLFTT